jgi:hypothetical protein
VLVKAADASVVERARTYLVTHSAQSQSGTAARTFGEAIQARGSVTSTIERLIYLAVLLTPIVAGCSLAVTVAGSMTERKRPFTLLRLTGTPVRTLYRVVLIEALLPLAAGRGDRGRVGSRVLPHDGRRASRRAGRDRGGATAAWSHHLDGQPPVRIGTAGPPVALYAVTAVKRELIPPSVRANGVAVINVGLLPALDRTAYPSPAPAGMAGARH